MELEEPELKKKDSGERTFLKQIDCLNNFYNTLAVLAQLSTPIKFEEVEPYPEQVKNIIIFGNIGQGKSSLLNKMFKFLNDF